MTSEQPLRPALVNVVGPPASGKSTLCAVLAKGSGVAPLRLRSLLERAALMDEGLARRIATTTDPLGWVSDDIVDRAFAIVLSPRDPMGLYSRRLLVFDNFPGRRAQVSILSRHLTRHGSPIFDHAVGTVILDESDSVLHARATARRQCPACEATSDLRTCRACDHATVRRLDDRPHVFSAKLARYRQHSTDLRAELPRLGRVVDFAAPSAPADALGVLVALFAEPGATT